MESDTEPNLAENLLSNLAKKYSEIVDSEINDAEALQDALSLLPHCRFFYFKPAISKYYDLVSRLADCSSDTSGIFAEIEASIRSGERDIYLPYLELLLILKINLIPPMLDSSTISYIDSIAQSNPLKKSNKFKRNRDGTVSNIHKYLYLIEYLVCLSYKILNIRKCKETDTLFRGVKGNLIQILYSEEESNTPDSMVYLKLMVNLIRCIGLILKRSKIEYSEYFEPDLLEKIRQGISNHFNNEEISEVWLELLCQIENKKPKSILVSYLTDTLIDTLHKGSNSILNTFLSFIESAQMQIFRHYLSKFDEGQLNNQDFKEKLFKIGILKFNSQSDKNIKDIITHNRCLLKLNDSGLLPDYCYEMLILLHKRSLIEEMKETMMDFITNFNRRLYTEMENMNVKRLCSAGEYISLLPEEPENKELAKKWIESIIKLEIIRIQSEDIFCLYTRILVLAYIPEDHVQLETSITQLKHISDRLEEIVRNNYICGESNWIPYSDRLYQAASHSISRLKSSIEITDQNFDGCKMLFRKFSAFLQEVADKLRESEVLVLGITLVESHNIEENTLRTKLDLLFGHLNLRNSIHIKDILERELPSKLQYADIRTLFNPGTVYQFFDSLLLWIGLTKILKYAVKYYDKNYSYIKMYLIDDMMNWSTNLASLASSNYLKYLNYPNLNEYTKAYLIHQISLCSINKINSISVLYSSIMKFILIEPTNAVDYDSSLKYVVNVNFMDIIAQIRGVTLDRNIVQGLPSRIFYGPLDSSTDGETIYGGYIILNQKYKADDDITRVSAKLTLVHELAHLIPRLEGFKYKYLTVSHKKHVRSQYSGVDSSPSIEKIEAGEFVETQLFGFKVKSINRSTIKFLNNMDAWAYDMSDFKQELKKCLNNKPYDDISLNRQIYYERVNDGKECVYRFPILLPDPEIKADEDNC